MYVWINFICWVHIAIGGLVVNLDFRVYVVLNPLFGGKIRVDLYGRPR